MRAFLRANRVLVAFLAVAAATVYGFTLLGDALDTVDHQTRANRGVVAALNRQIEVLEAQLAGLQAAQEDAALAVDLARLQIAALRQQVTDLGGTPPPAPVVVTTETPATRAPPPTAPCALELPDRGCILAP